MRRPSDWPMIGHKSRGKFPQQAQHDSTAQSEVPEGRSIRSLDTLQEKWLERFREMQRGIPNRRLTGPFLSVPPIGYDPRRTPSVLYIGKANAGWPHHSTVERLRGKTMKFLEERVKRGEYRSAFWKLALDVSRQLARSANPQVAPLQNLVWTNMCKIGVFPGNPGADAYRMQRDLAIETLTAEIAAYRPQLVFWVTGNYGLDIITDVVADPKDRSWKKEKKLEEKGLYWREPTDSLPAMLWTDHPQGKPRPVVEVWIEQACKLIGA